MKKIIFSALFFALSANTFSYSQNSAGEAQRDAASINVPPDFNAVPTARIPALNEVNSRAIRSFNKNYKNVTDVNWFQSSTGFIAAFVTQPDIKSFSYYDTKGNFEYLLRYYKEDRLPGEVRHLIKSKYYDYSIYQVTEVTRNSKMAYIIKLEDKRVWKTIKVVESEIVELDELTKS